jgi:hypothetical protein
VAEDWPGIQPAGGGGGPVVAGRGCSNSGEYGDGTGQCVARAASLGSRGCAEVVGWLGRRAGSRARRRLFGGGRRRDPSDELAARADQQVRARATGGPTKWEAARVGEEKQTGWGSP